MQEQIVALEKDYFVQVYDHYLNFARDFMNIDKQRKQFDYGLLIWFFKYWYSVNQERYNSNIDRYVRANISLLEDYIKPYLFMVEVEKNKKLVKDGFVRVSNLPLHKLDTYRKLPNWKRLTKEEVVELYSQYELMTHSSYEEIVRGIRSAIKRDGVIALVKKLAQANIITIYQGIHRDKNKNSYLYNPRPLNQYIQQHYLNDTQSYNDFMETEALKRLRKKGYQIIPPNNQKPHTPNQPKTETPKQPKTETPKQPDKTDQNTWDGLLTWAQTRLTKDSYMQLKKAHVSEGDTVQIKGQLSDINRQVILKYYSDEVKTKEVRFI